MEWDGKMSYGEFWVDPDAQDEEKGSEAGKNQEGKIQFLFKMDIQNLGFLEMALGAIDSQVDLSVYGPETMSRHGEVIAQDIREILKSHGLDGKSIRVIKEEKPLEMCIRDSTMTQRPDVVIKYVGGPLYVPPSSDPDYEPVDVKA